MFLPLAWVAKLSRAFLAGAMVLMAIPAAQAEEWCGYAAHAKSLIECGYSSVSECENAQGKGRMCFVDPEVARNFSLITPAAAKTHG